MQKEHTRLIKENIIYIGYGKTLHQYKQIQMGKYWQVMIGKCMLLTPFTIKYQTMKRIVNDA